MVAEGAGECLVGAIFRIQRDVQDVGRTGRQCACRLAETAGTHIAHDGKAGRRRERPHQMEAGDTGNIGDVVKCQRTGKMAFDKP